MLPQLKFLTNMAKSVRSGTTRQRCTNDVFHANISLHICQINKYFSNKVFLKNKVPQKKKINKKKKLPGEMQSMLWEFYQHTLLCCKMCWPWPHVLCPQQQLLCTTLCCCDFHQQLHNAWHGVGGGLHCTNREGGGDGSCLAIMA